MENPFVRSVRSWPGWGAVLVLVLVLLPCALFAQKKGPSGVRLQQGLETTDMNANNVRCTISNQGELCFDPFTGNGAGFFPANSPNHYVFNIGFWVGGIDRGQKSVVTFGTDFRSGPETAFGRAAPNGGGAPDILCSNNAADLAAWYPEFRDPATNEPIVFGQQDCVMIYNDAEQGNNEVTTPIGLQVLQRTMAFTFGRLSQVVFVVWDVEHFAGATVDSTYVAVAADMDIGVAFQDDRCSAIPSVPPGLNNSGSETVQTKLGFCWDSNFNEADFDPNPPGFVGVTFFQGPVSDTGDTLGITNFTLTTNEAGRPSPDPQSDIEQWQLMAGIPPREPFIDAVSTDMRFVHISGPFTLDVGDTQRVVAGILFANVSENISSLEVSPTRCFPAGTPCFLPDPNDPALSELIEVQRAAQVIFDAGFLAPGPPPKPELTLIPGNQQVTIVWSDVSQVPDPFFAIAGDPTSPAFDSLFREFDFEGFVLVRSTSGNPADVDTLATFDLANDVTVINDTTLQPFTIVDTLTGDTISVELPVSINPIVSDLPNTGLQFSFVDRGLINGIVYFYDVVPFDFNPSLTLRGPAISQSSGIVLQPFAVHAVRPRSDATSFRSASVRFDALKADGTVCDTEEPTATVDEATGKYVDFIDCSNAIVQATLQPLRDLNIPSGEFFFVIDSILPNDAVNPYAGGYALAFGFNTVWFHWEDADGNVATAIQPAVGSFNQSFDFTLAAEDPVAFGFDSDPSDVGPDLSIGLVVASQFSAMDDIEVNGQSLHLGELGGEHVPNANTDDGEARPHLIQNSSLADGVFMGNIRAIVNAREYSHPGVYAQGATSYELTWSVSGGAYSGTLRKLPGGEVVPQGGQPKGTDNPSTPDDFVAGYNWGFIAPGDPAAVRAAVFPTAAPLANTVNLNAGDTFAIMLPGQSVYVSGIRQLPQDGDRWTFLITGGSDRGEFFGETLGREPDTPTSPFSYEDLNDNSAAGLALSPVPFDLSIVNVYPGARWRLTIAGGSNNPGDVDLDLIKTVPNPYVANAIWDFSQDNQRVEFTNLPPECTIRIYTISGNLVRVLEHTDGSGTELWDLRTRFNLKAASGTYYWHVTTPDGRTRLGLMSIIQNEPSTL